MFEKFGFAVRYHVIFRQFCRLFGEHAVEYAGERTIGGRQHAVNIRSRQREAVFGGGEMHRAFVKIGPRLRIGRLRAAQCRFDQADSGFGIDAAHVEHQRESAVGCVPGNGRFVHRQRVTESESAMAVVQTDLGTGADDAPVAFEAGETGAQR